MRTRVTRSSADIRGLEEDRRTGSGLGTLAGDEVAGAVVARMHREGVAAHSGVRLEAEPFGDEVRWRAETGGADESESARERLARMERLAGGPDLYLAIGCDLSAVGAWDRLTAAYVPRLARALTAQGVPPAEADAVAADLPGDLIQPPRDAAVRTRLGLYRGLSSLFSFLTVAALRRFTNRLRSRKPASLDAHPVRDGEDLGAAPELSARASDSPLDDLVGEEAGERVDAILLAAWRDFTPKEALALLYKFRDGLPQTTIAAMLRVGEPRVSRLLARGIDRLREALAAVIGSRRDRLSPSEWAAVRTALERRLATFPIAAPPTDAAAL